MSTVAVTVALWGQLLSAAGNMEPLSPLQFNFIYFIYGFLSVLTC